MKQARVRIMKMDKKLSPKRHRFPMSIISYAVWRYHRFNDSYRDIQEYLAYRGIDVSHESIRSWCIKFGAAFRDIIKKRERKPTDKWNLDEMTIKVIVTDKLKSYVKPIKHMMKRAIHRSHKRLNNRVENAHQPTRRKEKCLIKFKSPHGVQRTLALMGKVRNIFSVTLVDM